MIRHLATWLRRSISEIVLLAHAIRLADLERELEQLLAKRWSNEAEIAATRSEIAAIKDAQASLDARRAALAEPTTPGLEDFKVTL